ncbi:MAG: hypothetical protein GEV03_24565 [Streptosporangiales bacterium]|nr:hypothetical protein [Streptosporangiales bacterium]
MTTLLQRRGQVTKKPQPHHPAETYLVEAMMRGGAGTVRRYVTLLRAAGVHLPDALEVVHDTNGEVAVGHPWVSGIPLLDLAADPEPFLAAVVQVAAWARDLDDTDARLDTNLANFVVCDDGRLVTVDVLPPLLTSLRPTPRNCREVLFDALCFDTPVTLCALAGYAGRALLTGGPDLAHGPAGWLTGRAAAVVAGLCPGHGPGGGLGVWWFHARTVAAARALAGTMPRDQALALFASTSVLALRDAAEPERQARVAAAHTLATRLGLP